MRLFLKILVLFVFTTCCKAQQLKIVPLTFSSYKAQNLRPSVFGNMHPINEVNSNLIITDGSKPYGLTTFYYQNTLPKGAIFCRMEDAIYSHLNFWVKFRMGTDDRYSN